MFEYVNAAVEKVDAGLADGTLADALASLRQLGLDDFGELLLSMPNPRFPNLSGVLPRMASDEVQTSWTGAHGLTLLRQTCSFVRSVAYNFSRFAGRSLSDAEILDFGCGYGRIARLMYYFTNPEHLAGVDPWDRSIQLCREAGLGENFRQSEYLPQDLPVGDARFDLIYAFSVFTHLSERATRQALQTLRRYIRDDGILVITIRPVEYWELGIAAGGDIPALIARHRRDGFAFQPHNREPVDGDITYGETSMTAEWITAENPGWRLAGVDRTPDDAYQLYAFLQPI